MSTLATLSIIKDGEVIRTMNVEGEVLLGRSEECRLRIDDKSISRQHALFRQVGDTFQVEKKSEFAPLSINGVESQQAALKDGDLILIGSYLIRVSLVSKAQEKKPDLTTTPKVEEIPQQQESALQATNLNLNDNPDSNLNVNSELVAQIENGPDNLAVDSNELAFDANLSSPTQDNGLETDLSASSGDSNAFEVEKSDSNIEMESDTNFSPAEGDGKTTLTPVAKIDVQLIFKAGDANFESYPISKDEIIIGRGKNCDIILKDKKSSRQNSLIRRAGMNFTIKDLDSVNGTFVNGVQITEQELAGEDVIRVGDTEFQLKAISADYAAKEKNFLTVPAESEVEVESDPVNGSGLDLSVGGLDNLSDQQAQAFPTQPNSGQEPLAQSIPGITGIPGMGAAGKKNTTLLEKFRALPKRTQMIGVVAAILFMMWLNEDDAPIQKKKPKPTKTVAPASSTTKGKPIENAPGPTTFDTLTPEQKQFVESQHTLAFDYYKNKEYDKALFEIRKIFSIIQDYKDAKEIERYAKEGKRKMDAIEEENRKKEEEQKLKSQIAELVEQARVKMSQKKYMEARELFSQIMALDPDNSSVVTWNKEIDAYDEEVKTKLQQKQVQEDINRTAQNYFNEAMQEKKQFKLYSAISTFQRVVDVGSNNQKLINSAKLMMKKCKNLIAARRDPVLAEARKLEEAGDIVQAFKLYQKATHLDSRHPEGYAGMNRIKKTLHDRAKVIYTEAIIAESYSDFDQAQKLFQDCANAAPTDDIYYERAKRKLTHYFPKKDEAPKQ